MSRTQEQIQNEYGRAAAELGQEVYLRSLAEEQITKHEYKEQKLKNQMQSLAKEAAALKSEEPNKGPGADSVPSTQEETIEQA